MGVNSCFFTACSFQAQESEKRLQEQERLKGKASKETDAKLKQLEDSIKSLQGKRALWGSRSTKHMFLRSGEIQAAEAG